MIEAGRDADFLEESVWPQRSRQLGPEHFDGDRAVMSQVVGTIDRGHPPVAENTLDTFRADASVLTASRIGLTGGFITRWGDSDTGLYAPDPVFGSLSGSPNSTGVIAELSAMPWLNTRIGLQYVWWTKFNGGKTDYDGSGRNAKDNNTLYGYVWLAF